MGPRVYPSIYDYRNGGNIWGLGWKLEGVLATDKVGYESEEGVHAPTSVWSQKAGMSL